MAEAARAFDKESILGVIDMMEIEANQSRLDESPVREVLLRYACVLRGALASRVRVTHSSRSISDASLKVDFDATFAQALQNRSRREAEQRAIINEGQPSSLLKGGPMEGDTLVLPDGAKLGWKTVQAGAVYELKIDGCLHYVEESDIVKT